MEAVEPAPMLAGAGARDVDARGEKVACGAG